MNLSWKSSLRCGIFVVIPLKNSIAPSGSLSKSETDVVSDTWRLSSTVFWRKIGGNPGFNGKASRLNWPLGDYFRPPDRMHHHDRIDLCFALPRVFVCYLQIYEMQNWKRTLGHVSERALCFSNSAKKNSFQFTREFVVQAKMRALFHHI